LVQYLSSYANIDTINRVISGSYIDLHLDIDSEIRLTERKLYGKKKYFNFPICQLPIICGNTCIWSIYISDDTIFQCLRFLSGLLLTRNLQNQVLLVDKLKSSQFNSRCHDLINRYGMYAPLVVAFLVHDVTSDL
jgi:hypothetical protein